MRLPCPSRGFMALFGILQPQLILRLDVLEARSALAGCTCTVQTVSASVCDSLAPKSAPHYQNVTAECVSLPSWYLLYYFANKPRNCLSRLLTLGDLIQDLHSLTRSKPRRGGTERTAINFHAKNLSQKEHKSCTKDQIEGLKVLGERDGFRSATVCFLIRSNGQVAEIPSFAGNPIYGSQVIHSISLEHSLVKLLTCASHCC